MQIDPVIFSFDVAGITIALRWYGVLIMAGVFVAGLLTARTIRNHGEDPEHVWDAMLWVLPAGVIGARLGYVINDILGGGQRFLTDPVRILRITEGGLHIYGAVALGLLVILLYLRRSKLDSWLFLDALAPTILVAQAIGRPANWINQELYGPPTTLPWGIPIDEAHRLLQYADLTQFPVATTRFHPTFAYEIIWNLLAFGILMFVASRFKDKIKPGTLFAGWLVAEGIGRFWLEWFRPDQPTIGDTVVSYSRIFALIMALVGIVFLLWRYDRLKLPGLGPLPDSYKLSPAAAKLQDDDNDAPLPKNKSARRRELKRRQKRDQ